MLDRNWQAELRQREQRLKSARQILGILDTDGAEEIKRAWRTLSLRHHPDHNDADRESHQKFILINSAYRCLTQGIDCEQLDSVNPQHQPPTPGKYRLDNPWGYFAWWREKYFE